MIVGPIPPKELQRRPPKPKSLSEIRDMYLDGAPLGALRRVYHLTPSEAQDVAPEEFEQGSTLDGHAGY